MRSHEEFCAELERRKAKLIKAKKTRQKAVLTCIPFVLCLGLIVAAGGQGRLHPEINSDETSVTEAPNDSSFLKITLPVALGGIESSSSSGAELNVQNAEDAATLMEFLQTYEEAFLYSSGDDGWYVYTRSCNNTVPPDAIRPESSESVSKDGSSHMTGESTEWETDTEWVVEETEQIEGTAPEVSESISPGKSSPDSNTGTEIDPETDFFEENTANALPEIAESESSFPQTDPQETTDPSTLNFVEESVAVYQFSSAELAHSVTDIDLVYIITVTTEEGKTVRYALDAVKYAELAERLNKLLENLEN